MDTEFPQEIREAIGSLLQSQVTCTVCGETKHAKEFRSWTASAIVDYSNVREGSEKNIGVCRTCENPPNPITK